MGDCDRAKWAEKGAAKCYAPFRGGSWVPIEHNVAWASSYLRTK